MKILVLTYQRTNEGSTTETRLRDELGCRGHEVTLIDIDELEKRAVAAGHVQKPQRNLLQKLFSNRQAYRMEYLLVPALKNHLYTHRYDVILPTQICAAEVMTAVLQSGETAAAFTALVSTEYDSLPRKASLCCDDYIVMSKHAINVFVDWGVSAERIHYIDVSDHTICELCDLIESLAAPWQEIKRAFQQHP